MYCGITASRDVSRLRLCVAVLPLLVEGLVRGEAVSKLKLRFAQFANNF